MLRGAIFTLVLLATSPAVADPTAAFPLDSPAPPPTAPPVPADGPSSGPTPANTPPAGAAPQAPPPIAPGTPAPVGYGAQNAWGDDLGSTWVGPSISNADELPYRDDASIPPGYHLEESSRSVPLVVGGVMLGISYATGLGIAAADGFANKSGWLALPVLGPWLALSSRGDPCDGLDEKQEFDSQVGACVAEPLAQGMLVVDGVLQAAGVALLLYGSGSDKKLVRDRNGVRVQAVPRSMGRGGYGLGVLGSF